MIWVGLDSFVKIKETMFPASTLTVIKVDEEYLVIATFFLAHTQIIKECSDVNEMIKYVGDLGEHFNFNFDEIFDNLILQGDSKLLNTWHSTDKN